MHLIGLGYAAEDIILVGDSAGGNLALSLCRYLIRYADEKFPSELSLPRILESLVSSSSLLLGGDVGGSHNCTRSRVENKIYDYVFVTPLSQEYTNGWQH